MFVVCCLLCVVGCVSLFDVRCAIVTVRFWLLDVSRCLLMRAVVCCLSSAFLARCVLR